MDPVTDLFARGKTVHYNKGQIIISSCDRNPPGVDLITQGFVRVYSTDNRQKSQSHIIYKPGEIYPLIWALNGLQKNYFYQALNSVTVLRLSRKIFLEQLTHQPKIALKLIDILANRLDLYKSRVNNLIISKSSSKIVARLLFFADRFGTQAGSDILINVPLTQESIAESIAIARETVNRELQRLESKGIIVYRNDIITIRNKDRLLAEMSEHYHKSQKTKPESLDKTTQLQSALISISVFNLYITEILNALPNLA